MPSRKESMEQLLQEILKQQEEIISRLKDISNELSKNSNSSQESYVPSSIDLDTVVTYYLSNLGITARVKGYYYLRTAIKMVIEKPDLVSHITRELYPAIAKEHKTTPSASERAICHAIEVGWTRASVDFVESIFPYMAISAKEKPKNSEFIAMIADHIRLHYSFD